MTDQAADDCNLILLTEYQDTATALSATERDYLLRETPGSFTVRPIAGEERYLLNPAQHVGVIALPTGRLVRCQPKVAVKNVFYMLATVLAPGIWREEDVEFADIDEVFDFFVERFAERTEDRLVRGLYRTYVEREENLSTVRGRILIAPDIRQNHILRHRTYCQFEEFTWDVPENQVIRQAVHTAGGIVRNLELRRRLALLDAQLGEIDPTPLPLSVFDRFTYHRLNDDYESIHQLAKLILENASVSEHSGSINFNAFLLDMNKLFEDFVTICLLQRTKPPWQLREQLWATLDEGNRVPIRPDLLYQFNREPVLVADCKYKRLNSGEYVNSDIYQALAYCKAFNLPRGALIYPRFESDVTGVVEVRHSNVQIKFFDVNLGVAMRELPGEMDRLSQELLDWASWSIAEVASAA